MSEAPTPAPEGAPVAAAPGTPAVEGASLGQAPAAAAEAPPAEGESQPDPAPKTPEEGSDTVASPIEVTLPEGFEANDVVLSEFKSLAAEAGLNSDNAQKIVDMYAKQVQGIVEAQTKAWTDTQDAWKAELAKDPELGGDKKDAAMVTIGRALDEYGTPEARVAFEQTGAGWNPAIVRLFHKMATALSEGGPAATPRPAAQPKRGVAALYGE